MVSLLQDVSVRLRLCAAHWTRQVDAIMRGTGVGADEIFWIFKRGHLEYFRGFFVFFLFLTEAKGKRLGNFVDVFFYEEPFEFINLYLLYQHLRCQLFQNLNCFSSCSLRMLHLWTCQSIVFYWSMKNIFRNFDKFLFLMSWSAFLRHSARHRVRHYILFVHDRGPRSLAFNSLRPQKIIMVHATVDAGDALINICRSTGIIIFILGGLIQISDRYSTIILSGWSMIFQRTSFLTFRELFGVRR